MAVPAVTDVAPAAEPTGQIRAPSAPLAGGDFTQLLAAFFGAGGGSPAASALEAEDAPAPDEHASTPSSEPSTLALEALGTAGVTTASQAAAVEPPPAPPTATVPAPTSAALRAATSGVAPRSASPAASLVGAVTTEAPEGEGAAGQGAMGAGAARPDDRQPGDVRGPEAALGDRATPGSAAAASPAPGPAAPGACFAAGTFPAGETCPETADIAGPTAASPPLDAAKAREPGSRAATAAEVGERVRATVLAAVTDAEKPGHPLLLTPQSNVQTRTAIGRPETAHPQAPPEGGRGDAPALIGTVAVHEAERSAGAVSDRVSAPPANRDLERALQLEELRAPPVRDGRELRLEISPEGLGRVEVRVAVRADAVHASVYASQDQTRDALEAHRASLESALGRASLRLEGFTVGLGNRHGEPEPRQEGRRTPLPHVVAPTSDPGAPTAVLEPGRALRGLSLRA